METTKVPKSYSYPQNPNIILWDLPGVGSTDLPDVETYYREVPLAEYDMFVIMTASRFTQHDQELAKKLKLMHKPFLFVRSKIDADFQNEKRKIGFQEKEMLRKIKRECYMGVKKVMKEMIEEDDIYLISNIYQDRWDFTQLQISISKQLPIVKKETFNYSLPAMSEAVVEQKVNELRGMWVTTHMRSTRLLEPQVKRTFV